jgi:hypothetical protein
MVPDAPERVLRQFELNAEAERTMLTGGLEAQKPTTAAATGWPLLSSSGAYCWRPDGLAGHTMAVGRIVGRHRRLCSFGLPQQTQSAKAPDPS